MLIIAALFFAALVMWRLVLVASGRAKLDLPSAAGALRILRLFGIACLYIGAVVFLLDLLGRPLLRLIFPKPGDAGVMFYVVGVYLAFLKVIGSFGILCFEFSRLRSFEMTKSVGDS